MLLLPCGTPIFCTISYNLSTLGICGPHIRETLCWFKNLCLVYEGWSRKSGLSLSLDLVLIDRWRRVGGFKLDKCMNGWVGIEELCAWDAKQCAKIDSHITNRLTCSGMPWPHELSDMTGSTVYSLYLVW